MIDLLFSGWSDCRIRSYYPESGRPQYIVNKAYGSKVTAVAAYHSCQRFVSGSDLGHVVVWDVPEPNHRTDVNHVYKHFLLKEHKAEVTCIQIRRNDSECVTSSIDGSCVIWDLELVGSLVHAFTLSRPVRKGGGVRRPPPIAKNIPKRSTL